MRSRMMLPAVLVAAALLAPATAGAQVPPLPFGHLCVPKDGVRFCPTLIDAQRVPSFDGVPLDVDVTLPATGAGPFPTVVLLHEYGGSKTAFEGSGDYSATGFARRGYAAVTPTARGFGRSCGVPDSRTPDCARGWQHLDDQRYEVRDIQQLLGILVDEGIAKADALGAAGASYGGEASAQLAYLRDRIRLPDGSLAPWRSPAGRPLSLAAAAPGWMWWDLGWALTPNGRLLDPAAGAGAYKSPIGVSIQAYIDALYGLGAAYYLAPPGADRTADLAVWKQRTDRGEPFTPDVTVFLDELHRFHSVAGIPPTAPAPLLIQQGRTDDLFPVGNALRVYDQLRARNRRFPVSLQLGDLGHGPAGSHAAEQQAFTAGIFSFFDAWLKNGGKGAPAPGSVTAYGQVCPRNAPSGGAPIRASSHSGLARGTLTLRAAARQPVTSSGGDASLSARLSPLTMDPCKPVKADVAPHTAIVTRRSPGFRLLGPAVIHLRAKLRGTYGELVGRLWDVDPRRGSQRLIDRGVTRVRHSGSVTFGLDGNAWKFARGHTVKVELLGRDGPTYRPSNTRFTITVSKLRVVLPTRERRG